MMPLDMNLKITEILGLRKEFCYLKADYKTGILYACDVIGDTPSEECVVIDYTTNKALCWDLMEILHKAGFYLKSSGGITYWWEHENNKEWWADHDLQTVTNPLLATCEAFIEEFCK